MDPLLDQAFMLDFGYPTYYPPQADSLQNFCLGDVIVVGNGGDNNDEEEEQQGYNSIPPYHQPCGDGNWHHDLDLTIVSHDQDESSNDTLEIDQKDDMLVMMEPDAKRRHTLQRDCLESTDTQYHHVACECPSCILTHLNQSLALEGEAELLDSPTQMHHQPPSTTQNETEVLSKDEEQQHTFEQCDSIVPLTIPNTHVVSLPRVPINKKKRKRNGPGSLTATSSRTRLGHKKKSVATPPNSRLYSTIESIRADILAATSRGERQLKHAGPRFVTPYVSKNTPFMYNGVRFNLGAEAEEAIYVFVASGSGSKKGPEFVANFFCSLQEIVCESWGLDAKSCPLQKFGLCDFSFFRSSLDSFLDDRVNVSPHLSLTNTAQDSDGNCYNLIGNSIMETYIIVAGDARGKIVRPVKPEDVTINITHPENAYLARAYQWKNVVYEPHNDHIAWWQENVTGATCFVKVSRLTQDAPPPTRSSTVLRLDQASMHARRQYLDFLKSPSFCLSVCGLRQDYMSRIRRACGAILKKPQGKPSSFDAAYIDSIRMAMAAWFVDHFGIDILPSDNAFCYASVRVCDIKLGGTTRIELKVKLDPSEEVTGVWQYRVPVRQCDDVAIHTVLGYLMREASNFEPKYLQANSLALLFSSITPSQVYVYMSGFFSYSFMNKTHVLLKDNLELALRVYNRNQSLNAMLEDTNSVLPPLHRRRDFLDHINVNHPMLDALAAFWLAMDAVVFFHSNSICVVQKQYAAVKQDVSLEFAKARAQLTWMLHRDKGRLCKTSKPSTELLLKLCDAISKVWSFRLRQSNSETLVNGLQVAIATLDPQLLKRYASKHGISVHYLYGETAYH